MQRGTFSGSGAATDDYQAHCRQLPLPSTMTRYRVCASGAWRSASRNSSWSSFSTSTLRICRCCSVASWGTSRTKTRSTGSPSRASKSIFLSSCNKAPTASVHCSRRQWGMAMPLPKPVEPSFSRAIRLSSMVSAFRWVCWAIRLPISSSTRFLEPPGTPAKVSSGDRICFISMLCRLVFLSVVDSLLSTDVLFLVLDQLSVKTVDQQVDGGIHVGVFGFGNQVGSGHVQGTFGFLLQFVYLEGDLGADDLVEVAFQTCHLFGHVVTQGIGYIKLETGNFQLHNTSPVRLCEAGIDPADSHGATYFSRVP